MFACGGMGSSKYNWDCRGNFIDVIKFYNIEVDRNRKGLNIYGV